MEIIVNEWLLEYLRPDAHESDRAAAIKFLNAFGQKSDKMIIKRVSPFTKKFYDYSKRAEQFVNAKPFFSMLHLLFRDADKTVIADESELQELPQDIAEKTPCDDRYLIELWYADQNRVVLTTDTKLKDKLKDVPGLRISLLEEFLPNYCV